MADSGNIIDKLGIEITSDINNANAGIEKLKSTLANLRDAYNQAGTGGTAVKQSLQVLSDGVKQMSGVDTSKLTDVSTALKTLSKNRLENFAKGIQNIDSATIDNLKGIANAINTLANVPDMSNAISGMRKLTKIDFIWLSASLSGLNESAFNALENLAVSMELLAGVPNIDVAAKNVNRLATIDYQGFATGLSSLNQSVFDKMLAFGQAIERFGNINYFDGIAGAVKATRNIASIDFKSFSDNVKNIDIQATEKLKTFMGVLSGITGNSDISDTMLQMQSFFSRDYSGFITFVQSASIALPQLAEGVKQFADAAANPAFISAIDKLASVSAVDFTGMVSATIATGQESARNAVPDVSAEVDRETEETQQSVSKLKTVLASIGDGFSNSKFAKAVDGVKSKLLNLLSVLGKIGKFSITALNNGFTDLGNKVKAAVKPVTQFVNSIGRILKYRAIRFVLSEISKAIKEGTDNMYQYSKAVGTDFAQSMDKLATSALYFKNSVGAMLAPIINALTPAIDKAVDKIVEFNNTINETIAKLTGASTWTRAIKIPKEYAESANKATKDTVKGLKEAKETLKDFQMGFDELNVISNNPLENLSDLGNTDSEKLKDEVDYTIMFEEVNVDVPSWIDALKRALDNSDFYGAGAILGNKLKDVFGDLPYEEWGKSLANAINNAVLFARGFLETSPFDELGEGIAKYMNTLFSEVDFTSLGYLLADMHNAVWTGVNKLLSNLDFKKIGLAFSDTFNGFTEQIDFDTMVQNVSLGLNGILTVANEFLENANIKEFAYKFGQSINAFDLKETIDNAGKLIKNSLDGILDAINGFLTGVDWTEKTKEAFQGILDFIFGNDWEGTGSKVSEALRNITDVLAQIGAGIVLGTDDEEFIENWVSEAELITSDIDNLKTSWKEITDVKNEKGGFWGFWEGYGEYVYDNLHPAGEELESLNKVAEEHKSSLRELSEYFQENGILQPYLDFWGDLGGKAFDFFEGVKSGLKDTGEKIKRSLLDAVKQIEKFKSDFKSKVSEFKDNILNFPNKVKEKIDEGFLNIAVSLQEWDGFQSFVEYIKSIPEKIRGSVSDIKAALIKPFESVPEALRDMANKSVVVVEDLANGIIGGFNGIGDSFKKTFSWANKIVGNSKYKIEIPKMEAVSLPRFEEGGFPNAGDLFFANEAGVAEMVGSIGNRTAVANNDQIVDAVSVGVSDAVGYVMSEYIPQIINAIMQNKTIEIDGKKISKEIDNIKRTSGTAVYSGGAF